MNAFNSSWRKLRMTQSMMSCRFSSARQTIVSCIPIIERLHPMLRCQYKN